MGESDRAVSKALLTEKDLKGVVFEVSRSRTGMIQVEVSHLSGEVHRDARRLTLACCLPQQPGGGGRTEESMFYPLLNLFE